MDANEDLRLADRLARGGKEAEAVRVYARVAEHYFARATWLKAVALFQYAATLAKACGAATEAEFSGLPTRLADTLSALGLDADAERLRQEGWEAVKATDVPAAASPFWLALVDSLLELVEATGAENAFVVEPGRYIVCRASPLPSAEHATVLEQASRAVAALDKPLRRGGTLDKALLHEGHPAYLRSIAQIYLLVLWLPGGAPMLSVRGAVNRALPAIERLILALPPTDGPASGEGVAAQRKA